MKLINPKTYTCGTKEIIFIWSNSLSFRNSDTENKYLRSTDDMLDRNSTNQILLPKVGCDGT